MRIDKAAERRAKFVTEYLATFNATEAAKRAGFSAKSAHAQGGRLLKHVAVQAALKTALERANAALALQAEAGAITAERVLRELGRIAFADARKLFTVGGGMLLPVDLDDDTAAAVASIEVTERPVRGSDGEVEIEHVRKVRLNDKLGALNSLTRVLRMVEGENGAGAIQVNVFVDRPPPETREQWIERVQRERLAQLPAPREDAA